MDSRIANLATDQHALVTRTQLQRFGLTDGQIDRLVKARRILRVHEGVYKMPGSPSTWHQHLLAACLSLGDGAAASHRAAAELWAFDAGSRGWVEVAGERLDKARPLGAVVHRSTDLCPAHVTVRFGIPVTKPARTLVDLGAVVTQAELNRAVDRALAKKLVSHQGLLVILAEVGRHGRRGVGKLRKSLAERTDAPESVLEAEFQRLVARYGLPEPVYQYELYDDSGRFVARIDAAYPDLRIAIELDGASTRVGRAALDYDNDRQNRIVDCGFLLRRYGWTGVVGSPEKTARDVDRTIERRRNELGLPAVA